MIGDSREAAGRASTDRRLQIGGFVRLAAAGLFLLALLTACSRITLPHDAAIAERTERRIVVLVPGITGVELVDPASREVVWGRGANLIAPRDHGYRLAVPLGESRPSADELLVPGDAIEEIRLGPVVKPVYGPIAELLENHGWQRGDLDDPAPTDDLFLFAYDWRLDNVDSARRLAEALEGVAVRRGTEVPVSLICQSNGAHVCRYLVKYGKATLDAAERGERDLPAGVRVEQLVLVGNANGGSLRILRYLNRGRKYVRGVGRQFEPEVFFTFESLYQDLPAYRDDLFVDPQGRPLEADLYDPATWRRYGWSIYGDAPARRLATAGRTDLFADAASRERHLERQLANARRFQAALKHDTPVGSTRYFLIQNNDVPTPDRAVLRPTAQGWETLITGDRQLERLEMADRVAAPGDGHATRESQLWLAPGEVAAFGAPPLQVDGAHFEMILARPTLERLLAILGAQLLH